MTSYMSCRSWAMSSFAMGKMVFCELFPILLFFFFFTWTCFDDFYLHISTTLLDSALFYNYFQWVADTDAATAWNLVARTWNTRLSMLKLLMYLFLRLVWSDPSEGSPGCRRCWSCVFYFIFSYLLRLVFPPLVLTVFLFLCLYLVVCYGNPL